MKCLLILLVIKTEKFYKNVSSKTHEVEQIFFYYLDIMPPIHILIKIVWWFDQNSINWNTALYLLLFLKFIYQKLSPLILGYFSI